MEKAASDLSFSISSLGRIEEEESMQASHHILFTSDPVFQQTPDLSNSKQRQKRKKSW